VATTLAGTTWCSSGGCTLMNSNKLRLAEVDED